MPEYLAIACGGLSVHSLCALIAEWLNIFLVNLDGYCLIKEFAFTLYNKRLILPILCAFMYLSYLQEPYMRGWPRSDDKT